MSPNVLLRIGEIPQAVRFRILYRFDKSSEEFVASLPWSSGSVPTAQDEFAAANDRLLGSKGHALCPALTEFSLPET